MTLREYLNEQYRLDPSLKLRVDAEVAKMEREIVRDNPRNLPVNPATGRFIDHVAAAYRVYVSGGGDKTFIQFHDSSECPQHGMCSECIGIR